MSPAADRSPPTHTPLQYVPGVGPQRAELFARLALHNVRDVLFFFPRDYEDLRDLQEPTAEAEGELVRLRGVVAEVDARTTASGSTMLGVLVRCGGQFVRCLWFNQPYLREHFRAGQHVLLIGKLRRRGLAWEAAHPRVRWLEGDETEAAAGLVPLYPLTEGLNQSQVRKVTRGVVDRYAPEWEEVFPAEYLAAHDLLPIAQAIAQMHYPDDRAALAKARRRLAYQELLLLSLGLQLRRMQVQRTAQATPLARTTKIDARIKARIPFELTAAQQQAIAEIAADLARPVPMQRLLQGDVGSGKTIVALDALLLCVAHGRQAVLMAPTEILARQHEQTLGRLLQASRVRVETLTSGMPAAERRAALARIAAGEAGVVIGTQAVIEEDVRFAQLALVVIDEQHKFGVRQRALLRQAGTQPHYLVLTATPIPRSLALAVYGDLDVTTLREAPPGRQEVHTYLVDEAQRDKWWEFCAKKLREGRQGYVVAPRVLDSDDEDPHSVQQAFESLSNGPLEGFTLDVLHGRMSTPEKDAVMERFRAGRTQALIATTVIEVGVDVPNATLLTILGGQNFGLAQLHQLRGRVSRGAFPGFCTVFAEVKTDAARERLEAFVRTRDGFELAEIDFRLRGPGELLGTRQHGLAPFRVADLVADRELLEQARADAQEILARDPELADPQWARMRKLLWARYGQVLELGDVG